MIDFKDLKRELLSKGDVKAEYERLEPGFQVMRSLIAARTRAKMTQAEVAEAMGKTQPYIARLESGKANPSIETVRRYAKATKQKITIEVLP